MCRGACGHQETGEATWGWDGGWRRETWKPLHSCAHLYQAASTPVLVEAFRVWGGDGTVRGAVGVQEA